MDYGKYVVVYHGVPVLRLNANLAKAQGVTDTELAEIADLHCQRLNIVASMESETDPAELKKLFADWTENQYLLQDKWHFKRSANYHKWWDVPHCTCPKLDNDDAYPSGDYFTHLQCPIHGSEDALS